MMSSFSKIVRATNWKYAIGEVTLIFVGITLALLANSIYETAKSRTEEREILGQIVLSLQSDVEDFRDSQTRIGERVQLMTVLERHIEQGLPYMAELDEAFKSILMVSETRMNTAAFETLASRGIGLVSSTTLRGQLMDYYDSERSRLDRRNEFDSADSAAASQYFMANFLWSSESLLMTPIDYESLTSDPEFQNALALRLWAQKKLTLPEYSRIERKAGALLKSIEIHLEK